MPLPRDMGINTNGEEMAVKFVGCKAEMRITSEPPTTTADGGQPWELLSTKLPNFKEEASKKITQFQANDMIGLQPSKQYRNYVQLFFAAESDPVVRPRAVLYLPTGDSLPHTIQLYYNATP